MTSSEKIRLEKRLSGYAKKTVTIDGTSYTSVLFSFVDELSMFRIAEKMRDMKGFKYGYSKNLKKFYVSLEIN